jgi:excisionase family DNA binding protein
MTRLMTVEEVADQMRVTPEYVQTLARKKKIPAVRIGRFWRFDPDAVDRWLRERLSSADH